MRTSAQIDARELCHVLTATNRHDVAAETRIILNPAGKQKGHQGHPNGDRQTKDAHEREIADGRVHQAYGRTSEHIDRNTEPDEPDTERRHEGWNSKESLDDAGHETHCRAGCNRRNDGEPAKRIGIRVIGRQEYRHHGCDRKRAFHREIDTPEQNDEGQAHCQRQRHRSGVCDSDEIAQLDKIRIGDRDQDAERDQNEKWRIGTQLLEIWPAEEAASNGRHGTCLFAFRYTLDVLGIDGQQTAPRYVIRGGWRAS